MKSIEQKGNWNLYIYIYILSEYKDDNNIIKISKIRIVKYY